MAAPLPETFVPGFHDEAVVRKMKYNPLGPGGRLVSALSLGCSSFGGVFHGVDEGECIKVVHAALKAGINVLDTAPWYGHGVSEQVLGKALVGIPRQAYYLHTKVCRYNADALEMFDFTYSRTIASVHESLARMGVEYIDSVQVHDPEFAPSIDLILTQVLPALAELKAAGKIKYIGITGYPLEVLRTLAERSTVKVDTALSYCHYNLHDRSLAEDGVAAFLHEKGIGVINASPLSMGLLTARGPPAWHPSSAALKTQCAAAAAYATAQGVDIAHLALVFCLEGPFATTMVSTSSLKRLQDDVDCTIGAKPLSPHEREVMNHIIATYFTGIGSMRSWEGAEVAAYWVNYGKAVATHWYARVAGVEPTAPGTLTASSAAAAASQVAAAATIVAAAAHPTVAK